jgi:hypothetical protein
MTNISLRISLVIISLLLIWQSTLNIKSRIQTQTVNNECDSLKTIVDSLRNEAFIYSIDAARYEVALEILKEQDSLAANKYENILYTETE